MASTNARHRPKGRFVLARVKLTMGKITTIGSADGATRQLNIRNGGVIRGISMDFSASANASGVVTIKEATSTGATLFTSTTGTDTTNASTGNILMPCTDARSISNADLGDQPGLHFKRGLNLAYTAATAGDNVIVRLLIDTSVKYYSLPIALTGADGSAAGSVNMFLGRPGILKAVRLNASAGATADLTIAVDNDNKGSNAGATVFTATNYGTSGVASAAGTAVAAGLSNGGLDEVNGAVTSPGGGIPFMHGLKATIAQANAADLPVIEYWVEV
jgi:hypothetical protein